ncbi:alpha/beta fold hydrolase [Actinomadura roseirufa]|uniref:alpha/beta fold hydrolase n=1 Tax=Actinomadura roseirufa TaxID=2094049 RepID=UPI001041B599|nr:alpha/beta fold hydrolase [Actinomadura roseirufa]
MSSSSTPLLFVHGFWFGSWCWTEVMGHVASTGRPVHAVDLAGHGLRARRPRCLTSRPFDPDDLATEVSPVSDVHLEQAGDLLVAQIKRLGRGAPITVVAHSMGGAVLTNAAQQAPDLVAHAVYLTAFMPASGVPADVYAGSPENAGGLVSEALRGDPAVIGALRLDLASADAGYRRQLRRAFLGDVDPVTADAALGLLSPDAPLEITRGVTHLTEDGWGAIPRTYVTCAQDMALRPRLQERFITEADAAFPENPTHVVALNSSHSPFLSMPARVAAIIERIS